MRIHIYNVRTVRNWIAGNCELPLIDDIPAGRCWFVKALMGADLKQTKEEAPICRAHLTNNIGVIVDGLLGQNAFNSDIMAIMQDFIGVCRRQIRNWVKSIHSLFILTIHLGGSAMVDDCRRKSNP